MHLTGHLSLQDSKTRLTGPPACIDKSAFPSHLASLRHALQHCSQDNPASRTSGFSLDLPRLVLFARHLRLQSKPLHPWNVLQAQCHTIHPVSDSSPFATSASQPRLCRIDISSTRSKELTGSRSPCCDKDVAFHPATGLAKSKSDFHDPDT